MQKLAANPTIHSDCPRNFMHITTNPLAKVGDFIDKRNLDRQKRVGSVLD